MRNEQRTKYGYDAFGRRSWKHNAFGITRFIWERNRLLSGLRGSRHNLWIYEDNSIAPLAQISLQQGETEHEAQVNWYHNDVSGLPRELTGAAGLLFNTLTCTEMLVVRLCSPSKCCSQRTYRPSRFDE